MATWEDGPEYAPLARPDEFAAPATEPLPASEPAADLSAGAPLAPPQVFEAPRQTQPDLGLIAPEVRDPRDPQLAYHVASSVMTPHDSAWGSAHTQSAVSAFAPPTLPGAATAVLVPPAHAFDPSRPIALQDRTDLFATSSAPARPTSQPVPPYGPPGSPAPFQPGQAMQPWGPPGAPPAWQSPAVQTAPVTLASLAKAVTPGVLFSLGLGLIPFFAPVAYLAGFGFAALVRYRQATVRTIFAVGTAIIAIAALFGLATSAADMGEWWSSLAQTAWWVDVVSALAVVGTIYLALRAQERPAGPR